VLVAVFLTGFVAAQSALAVTQTSASSYTVTYNGNGSSSGIVPADNNKYAAGAKVIVLGNSGNLAKSGYTFAGWNTSTSGSGTTFAPAASFVMGSAGVILYAKWTAVPTYTVTYSGNSSTIGTAPVNSTKYTAGAKVTVLGNTGNLAKSGYTFAGWNTSASGTGTTYAPAASFTIGTANIILYAKWTLIPTYSVTYSGNGSTSGAAPADNTKYMAGAKVTVLANSGNLAKSGYTFAGWNTSAGGTGTNYAPAASFTIGTAGITLFAKWTLTPTYSVIYSGNGSTSGTAPADNTKYTAGAKVTVLGNTGNLAKSGYTFAGWNTSASGTGTNYAPAATFTMGNANVTLYATWTPIPTYSVTYSGNGSTGGTAPSDSNKYAAGARVTVLGNTGNLARSGYTFGGWNTSASSTGTTYAPAVTFTMSSANVTLYAMWTPTSTHSVTYSGNGSTSGNAPFDYNSYLPGSNVTVQGNTGALAKSGYTFGGWNTSAGGNETGYAPAATFTMGSANVTLYAMWISTGGPSYSVTYSAFSSTSGDAPVDPKLYTAGASVTVLGNTGLLTKTGYSFAQWNTKSTGLGTGYAPGKTFTMGGNNVTLYPQWTATEPTTFPVIYNGNGSLYGAPPVDPNYYAPGAAVTVKNNLGQLFNFGQILTGWNTAANGSGTAYAFGASMTMPAAKVTLYAQWKTADGVASIWGGAREVIVLKSDGTVWTWGYNSTGQLGDGTTTYSSEPVQVQGPGGVGYLTGITAIMGGERHNTALKSDGTVWAWGYNLFNQLGNGNDIDSWTPVQVSGLTNVVSLGGRGYHTLAVKADGTVWAWGTDRYGALGNGIEDSNDDYPVPVQVPGVYNPIMVSAGFYYNLALLQDHTLVAWGNNASGQLGDGTTTDHSTPEPVLNLTDIVWVSAGWDHAVAVKADGTVWTWGSNDWLGAFDTNAAGIQDGYGALGDGSTLSSSVPVQVPGLSKALMASGGDAHTAVLLADGTVWTFGCNGAGQLGNGDLTLNHQLTPVKVENLSGVLWLSARDFHNQVLLPDGTIWSWGSGTSGELGNGTWQNSGVPVQVTPF
jgi:uncharacterized repeat protein (TIGR02543 family)